MVKLKPVPNKEWQQKYNKLMKDEYLSKKYNRDKRIKAKRKYITEHCPEIKHCKDKLILDIGPGPGEFLEVCREFGHRVMGIDAPINDCEMGNEYIQLSRLMTKRQKLGVIYCGFEEWLKEPLDDEFKNTAFLINLQGSLEQCFKDYMTGPPHRETKNAGLLSWVIDDKLKVLFYKMFAEFDRILEDGGYVLIYGNGAKNAPQYDNLILRTAEKFPAFKLYKKQGKTLHKFRKVL